MMENLFIRRYIIGLYTNARMVYELNNFKAYK